MGEGTGRSVVSLRCRVLDDLATEVGNQAVSLFVSSGVMNQPKTESEEPEQPAPADVTNEVKEEDGPATASKFATRTQAKAKRKKTERVDRDFAAFEEHSNGFGSKLLAKWGFNKNKGLGKDGRGRLNPIQADVRAQQNAGLGFGKRHVPIAKQEEEDAAAEADEEARQLKKAQRKSEVESNWRKSLKPKKKIYKDAASLVTENETATHAPQVVIDMRGPNVKMTSLDKWGHSHHIIRPITHAGK